MTESMANEIAERTVFRRLSEEGNTGKIDISTQRWNEMKKRWEVTVEVVCDKSLTLYEVHIHPVPCVFINTSKERK